MKLLIGGAVSAVLGLIGLIVWITDFINLLKGGIPLLLLLGGVIAAYIGFDDIQGSLREERRSRKKNWQKLWKKLRQSKPEQTSTAKS